MPPLIIQDLAVDAAGRPMFRFPIRVTFGTPDPFVLLTGDSKFRVGESVNAGGYTVVTARDGGFTLSLPRPSETRPSPLVVTITLPDGGQYSGVAPEVSDSPLTLDDLWSQYAWNGPQGPGTWAYPAASQLIGMTMIDGPGLKAPPPPVYEQNYLVGDFLI